MSEKNLAKAQVRKIANLVIFEAKKPCRNPNEFVNQLMGEYPALKNISQQKMVLEKADTIEKRERAMREITSKLLERIN